MVTAKWVLPVQVLTGWPALTTGPAARTVCPQVKRYLRSIGLLAARILVSNLQKNTSADVLGAYERMAGVLEETGNPGNLVSAKGIAKLFLPIR